VIHYDKTRRAEAIEAISVAVGRQCTFPEQVEVIAIVDNAVVGGVVVIENEVHVGVVRPIYCRGLIRELFKPILKKYGKATTKVRAANTIGQKFVERLGFTKTGTSEEVVTYELHRIRHA
jgi:hypothetical protein